MGEMNGFFLYDFFLGMSKLEVSRTRV